MSIAEVEIPSATSEAYRFLSALCPVVPAGAAIPIFTVPDDVTHWCASAEEAASAARRLAPSHNVYVGTALQPTGLSSKRRGTAATAIGIPGMWTDIDIHNDHHKQQNLPANETEVRSILARLEITPTIIVHSGGGIHAWWLFPEPWIFSDEQDRKRAAALAFRWNATIKAHAQDIGGWKLDSVHDLARVLRPPETLNHNYDPALPVRLLEFNEGLRYDPAEFEPYLIAAELEPEKHESRQPVEPNDLDDRELLERAKSASNGDAIRRLYQGDTSAYGGDDSAADQALNNHLAFWTGRDASRMDRLFRSSGLMRDKWDEVHYSNGDTYGEGTIKKAIAGCRECYTPGYAMSNGSGKSDKQEHDSQAAEPTSDEAKELDVRASLLTDVGNAARFVRRHGPDVRYCHPWGKWLAWNGQCWERDERGLLAKLATQTALNIYREAAQEEDADKRNAILKHAAASQKRERISAMLELAKPYIPVVPAELDANPLLLNAQNGTVDLHHGELRAHRREDYLTKICHASYNLGSTCPTFRSFLNRIFRTYPLLIGYVQKALGYGITGLTQEQVLFFLFGTGANGKTTLMDAVQHVLGDYASKADRDLLTAAEGTVHPTSTADLMGRRIVVCSETEDGRRFDESKLKDLVGETRLKARFMRMDFFEFAATHKIFLYGNHKPLVRGTDFGFWRRMRVIPFVEVITDEEKNTELLKELMAEADGILTWIVQGCLCWQRDGLGLPDEVARATDGYRGDMDSIGTFLVECCLFGDELQATAKDLYVSYCGWCEDTGERPLSQKRLGMQLAERNLVSDRCTYSGRKIWRGIGLKVTPTASNQHESFGGSHVQ